MWGGTGNKVVTGSFTESTSTTTKVTLGFKPKKLTIYGADKSYPMCMYDEDLSTTYYYSASSSSALNTYTLPNTQNYRIKTIDSDGFTVNKSGNSSMVNFRYYAVG